MQLTFRDAKPEDAPEIAGLRTAAAGALTARYGEGHWSSPGSERGAGGVYAACRLAVEATTRSRAASLTAGEHEGRMVRTTPEPERTGALAHPAPHFNGTSCRGGG